MECVLSLFNNGSFPFTQSKTITVSSCRLQEILYSTRSKLTALFTSSFSESKQNQRLALFKSLSLFSAQRKRNARTLGSFVTSEWGSTRGVPNEPDHRRLLVPVFRDFFGEGPNLKPTCWASMQDAFCALQVEHSCQGDYSVSDKFVALRFYYAAQHLSWNLTAQCRTVWSKEL